MPGLGSTAGATQATMGVSGSSGMIPRWPRRPWTPRARTGVALATGKGGRWLRTQSRRWTHQRLVVEGWTSQLGQAAFNSLMSGLSRCPHAPASARMLTSAGVSVGLDGEPAARPDTHRSGAYPTSCWQLVGHVGSNPGFERPIPQMIQHRASPLFARDFGRGGLQTPLISADRLINE